MPSREKMARACVRSYRDARRDGIDSSRPAGVAPPPAGDTMVRVCGRHRRRPLLIDPNGDALWCEAGSHRPRSWIVVRRENGHIAAAGREGLTAWDTQDLVWLPDGVNTRDLLVQACGRG